MNRSGLVGRGPGGLVLGLAALAMAFVSPVPELCAEDAPPAARAVRLSSVDGPVRISQGGQVLADPAVANTPLFEGTQVATSDQGKAEIQFEDGSVVRLSPDSALTLTVLRQQGGSADAEIAVEGGLVYCELQGESPTDHIRVRFGDSVVTAGGFTVLRINLDNPPGELAVFSGNAHLERAGALTLDLHGGESVALNAADPSGYNLAESIEPDSWDTWNSDRDQALNAEAAAQTPATSSFANHSNPAWGDLDANGNWYNVPGQGYVWSPYEAAGPGWDPYGNGRWMWTPRFGYVWVSDNAWGYLPYQCGAWNYYDDFGWGWAPGMGFCQPWWGGGMYGLNIGLIPGGYRAPLRPHPRPAPGRGGRWGPHPVIAVNRRSLGGSSGLPARDKAAPVVIAGHAVEPLRRFSPRPQYDRGASGFMNRSQPSYPGARMTETPGRPSVPYYGGGREVRPAAPGAYYGGNPMGNPSAPRTYYGGGQRGPAPSHPYSGGANSGGSSPGRSFGGGGGNSGGGGSHVSSGGGSAGGGGSHGGGGGGGSGGSHH
jgi:hypothetical protein